MNRASSANMSACCAAQRAHSTRPTVRDHYPAVAGGGLPVSLVSSGATNVAVPHKIIWSYSAR